MESEEPMSPINEADHAVLAERLREAREYLGLKQEIVADKLGLQRPAISSIENGKRKVSVFELKQFARLYQRPISFFLGTENPVPVQDDLFKALYRATRPLSESDREQVIQFATFLRSAGKPPLPKDQEED